MIRHSVYKFGRGATLTCENVIIHEYMSSCSHTTFQVPFRGAKTAQERFTLSVRRDFVLESLMEAAMGAA